MSILKASLFFFCVSKVFFLLLSFFFSFIFLVSDSSSSSCSLSRTESPLHLFVSSHLHPHPKPDTFVWPPAARSFSDPGPRQEPSLCKHGLWLFCFHSICFVCLAFHPLIIFLTDKLDRKPHQIYPREKILLIGKSRSYSGQEEILVPKFQPPL